MSRKFKVLVNRLRGEKVNVKSGKVALVLLVLLVGLVKRRRDKQVKRLKAEKRKVAG